MGHRRGSDEAGVNEKVIEVIEVIEVMEVMEVTG
jgi:hypothetical protein